MRTFGSAEAVYDAVRGGDSRILRAVLSEAAARDLEARAAPDAMHSMMLAMQAAQMQVLGFEDALYSDALRSIPDPPAFLFCQGDPARMGERCLTIIGARVASPRALAACEHIAEALSRQGVTIVSGLAAGIDSAAHEGSLAGGTPGIGVMACGLDVDYPTHARDLKRRMLEAGGLLVSEMPPGSKVIRGSFPRRNRILSGLSRGVVLMEAKIRSGSMSTVQHALDQGRDVFAWPGEPGSDWSEGAHQLIREGARYFTDAGDLLEDMGWEQESAPTNEQRAQLPDMTPEMHTVLTVLHRGEKSLDELAAETGFDAGQLACALTLLQMYGCIRALPGKIYCVV